MNPLIARFKSGTLTDFGPENITRLRRFATGILESFRQPEQTIAEMMRKLSLRIRSVFDNLRMTKTHARQSGDWRTNLLCAACGAR